MAEETENLEEILDAYTELTTLLYLQAIVKLDDAEIDEFVEKVRANLSPTGTMLLEELLEQVRSNINDVKPN